MLQAPDEHAQRADAGGGAMNDPIEASMDAAVARLAAAKARAEERDQASLAALLRLERGQTGVRDELAALRECLERIEKVLVRGAGDHKEIAALTEEMTRLRTDMEPDKKLTGTLHAHAVWLVVAVLGAAASAALVMTPYWPWHWPG
jgi:hypothetical protein